MAMNVSSLDYPRARWHHDLYRPGEVFLVTRGRISTWLGAQQPGVSDPDLNPGVTGGEAQRQERLDTVCWLAEKTQLTGSPPFLSGHICGVEGGKKGKVKGREKEKGRRGGGKSRRI